MWRRKFPYELLGDPNRIRQIIVNLVSNAVKFTQQGEISVDVSLEKLGRDNTLLHLVVEDTGIGIPPDKLGLIFEAFRQTDSSTTRRFGGTGLGLSISSQLVELMGGKIVAESPAVKNDSGNYGSRFRLTIPFDMPADKELLDTQPPPPIAGHVLLFSENSKAANVYHEMLTGFSARCTMVRNFDDAVRILTDDDASERPASIVIDVAALKPQGLRLAEKLRGNDATKKIPIVMLTPAGQVDVAQRCSKLGIEQCLIKPAKSAEIAEAIAEAHGLKAKTKDPSGLSAKFETAARPLSILVADDSPVNQEVAAGMLGLCGHHVERADDGRQAIAAAQEKVYDLIFMDIEMPDMDGLEATRAIREYEQGTGQRHRSSRCRPTRSRDFATGAWKRAWMDISPSRSIPPSCSRRSIWWSAKRPRNRQLQVEQQAHAGYATLGLGEL